MAAALAIFYVAVTVRYLNAGDVTHAAPLDSTLPQSNDFAVAESGPATHSNQAAAQLPNAIVAGSDCLRDAAVVVLAHNRQDTLARTLAALMSQPAHVLHRFTVYVSLDMAHEGVRAVVLPYITTGQVKALWEYGENDKRDGCMSTPHRIRAPDGTGQQQQARTGYFHIAVHIGCVLMKGFELLRHSHVVVLEDDLMPAPDFLSFFTQVQQAKRTSCGR